MFPTKALPPDAGLWKCRDLDGLWLFSWCGYKKCSHGGGAQLLADLIKQRPILGMLELARVVDKLRCRECRKPPARVVLMRSFTGEPRPLRRGNSRDQIEIIA